MNQLNSLILEGNVVKVPVVNEPLVGFTVAKFPMSVSRFFKNNENVMAEEVSYFDIECYGETAKTAEEKCKKGRGIRVVGRLKQERWTDSENKTHSRVYVVAEHIEYKPVVKKVVAND